MLSSHRIKAASGARNTSPRTTSTRPELLCRDGASGGAGSAPMAAAPVAGSGEGGAGRAADTGLRCGQHNTERTGWKAKGRRAARTLSEVTKDALWERSSIGELPNGDKITARCRTGHRGFRPHLSSAMPKSAASFALVSGRMSDHSNRRTGMQCARR